jgi:hypothetical protein
MEVRVGEVFMAGAEKAEFPGFGVLQPVKTAPYGDEHGSRRIRTDRGGSQEGEWVYTEPMPGAEMEIPDNNPVRETSW